ASSSRLSMLRPHPPPPPFPYTTLFRSLVQAADLHLPDHGRVCREGGQAQCGNSDQAGDWAHGPEHTGGAYSRPLTSGGEVLDGGDRKSTRLNSSHVKISYAVFCLKKKK